MRVLPDRILLLLLQRFFIGYWILKTGLDIYPGPFLLFRGMHIPLPDLPGPLTTPARLRIPSP